MLKSEFGGPAVAAKTYKPGMNTATGKDVVMTPALKKRVAKAEAKQKRIDSFYLGPGESMDSMRERVREALRKRFEKEVSGKKNKDGSTVKCPADYTWIEEMAPGKAIYERENQKFGVTWKNDGKGGVELGPSVPVEKTVEYKEVTV